MQGLSLQSSVKLRLLCSQVLKDLLGQGIDVSAAPHYPHDPVDPPPRCPESEPDTGRWVTPSRPPWIPGILTAGCGPGAELVHRCPALPEGLLSP